MTADLDSLRPCIRQSAPGWTTPARSLWLAACLGAAIVAVTIRLVSHAQVPHVPLTGESIPTRILSVNVMSDEILLALVPERLIALSVLADSPDSSNIVREATVIPTRVNADSEGILMLNPDLVFIGSHRADVARQVESFGIPLFQIQGFESIEWVRSLIRMMGARAGVPERAERLVAEMNARIEGISARVADLPRPRVLLYSESGWVSGRKTTLDDAVRAAGGVNVAAEMGIVGGGKVPQERVIMADPDVILLRDSRTWESGFRQALLRDPAFQGVQALRHQRVYSIPARLLVTSSHHIAETVETIARHLHPEAFPEASP
ncbi:MAG: ABC transporter substrate-binding protein [Nitrospiraceae bacterium]